MRTNSPGSFRRTGFTLVELLVVIGIIVLLIAILLPAMNKVRQAAYVADTQAEISTIASACTAYYTDFSAYPGPFSNDQVELSNTGALTGPSGSPSYSGTVSMPQNLVLGLLGGLTIYNSAGVATNPPTYYLDTTSIGQGPLSLNVLAPGRKTSYITNVQGILSNGQFQDEAGNKGNDNSGIPVLIDRFPSGTLPILYLRARTSALGVIAKAQGGGRLQFDVQQYAPYEATSPVLGAPQYGAPNYTATAGAPGHGLRLEQNSLKYNSVTQDFPTNALVYFTNPNTVVNGQSASTIQLQDHPRQIDQFILIAAGKDGTYGTPDDITSYGGVSQ